LHVIVVAVLWKLFVARRSNVFFERIYVFFSPTFILFDEYWYCIPIYVSSFFGLDAPGTLHQVIDREIERRRIVNDEDAYSTEPVRCIHFILTTFPIILPIPLDYNYFQWVVDGVL
jgi:hypothetical protein